MYLKIYIKKFNILKKNLIYIQDNFFKFIKIKNIMSKKTWLIWTIKLLFGLVILFILFYKVGIYNILNTIKSINPIYLLPLIITFLSDSLLATLNIKILLKAINLKLKYKILLNYVLYSWALALFTPSRIGEFSIVYHLKKEEIPSGEALAIILIDKLITFVSLSIISLVGFYIFYPKIFLTLLFSFISTIIILLFLISNDYLKNLFVRYILRNFAHYFQGFRKTLFLIIKKKFHFLLLNFLLTILKWCITSFTVYFIFLSLSNSIPLYYIFIINAMMVIVSLIPFTLSGLGIRELISVALYSKIGIPTNIATSMLIILLTISYLWAIIVIFSYKHKNI